MGGCKVYNRPSLLPYDYVMTAALVFFSGQWSVPGYTASIDDLGKDRVNLPTD